MSVFRLSKNDEEIKLHMAQYIEHANSLGSFYQEINFVYRDSDWEAGWIEFTHKSTQYDMNRYGNVHGGIIVMLVDTAAGLTSYECGTGNASPTMDMNINFLKAVHVGDEMVMHSQILNCGKHSCVVQTEVYVNGELTSTAVTTHRMYTTTTPEKPVLILD